VTDENFALRRESQCNAGRIGHTVGDSIDAPIGITLAPARSRAEQERCDEE